VLFARTGFVERLALPRTLCELCVHGQYKSSAHSPLSFTALTSLHLAVAESCFSEEDICQELPRRPPPKPSCQVTQTTQAPETEGQSDENWRPGCVCAGRQMFRCLGSSVVSTPGWLSRMSHFLSQGFILKRPPIPRIRARLLLTVAVGALRVQEPTLPF